MSTTRFRIRKDFMMLHFFNYLSIYWCNYLKNETKEYWTGYRRKRLIKVGKLTLWVRA